MMIPIFSAEGILSKKYPAFSGENRGSNLRITTTTQQRFVIEVGMKYFLDFTAFNRWVDELQKINEGDRIKVNFQIICKEYNGRVYNNLRVTSIQRWLTPEMLIKEKEQAQYER